MNGYLGRDERKRLRDLGWRRLFSRKAKRPGKVPKDAVLVLDHGDDQSIEVVELENRR